MLTASGNQRQPATASSATSPGFFVSTSATSSWRLGAVPFEGPTGYALIAKNCVREIVMTSLT